MLASLIKLDHVQDHIQYEFSVESFCFFFNQETTFTKVSVTKVLKWAAMFSKNLAFYGGFESRRAGIAVVMALPTEKIFNSLESFLNKFADDTKIGRIVNALENVNAIQKDLDRLECWTEANWMKFNVDK